MVRSGRGRSRAGGALRHGAAVAAGAAVVALSACGGDDMTGPGDDGTAQEVNLSVGESQVVTPASGGVLRFRLPGPGSSGAEYRLAVQSAARSTGTTPVRLALTGGTSSSSSAAARVVDRRDWRVREIGPRERDLMIRQRVQRNALELLRRRGIRPSPGYRPGVSRTSMLPTGEVPSEGDTLRFWFNVADDGTISCDTTSAEKVTGIVRAVGDRVAMVEDSAAELSLTQQMQMDYDSLASEFDRNVFGLDVTYFGAPTDIDGNQRVLVLFTTKVNEFSAAQEGEGFAGGFFLGTDLADSGDGTKDGEPATFGGQGDSDPDDQVCDASNEAEIMWLIAPDPDNSTGEEMSIPQARQAARSTSSHEFQHMLNTGNRTVDAPDGGFADVEDTWLDEGLSHVAEEIVGLGRTGKSLRDNLTAADVLGSPEEVDAFNTFLGSNFANAARYLHDPQGTQSLALSDPSPIPESLKMRGFAWIFLRWLADQEAPDGSTGGLPGSGEEQLFRALAGADGSLETGIANLEASAGDDWPGLLSDFALAMTADDDAATSGRQQVLTWDLRDVYAELNAQSNGSFPFERPYPLAPTQQGFRAATFDFQVQGGGGRYFTVAASGSASDVVLEITDQTGAPLTTGSPQVSIVRVQ